MPYNKLKMKEINMKRVKAKEEILLRKLNKMKVENHHSQMNLEAIRRTVEHYTHTYEKLETKTLKTLQKHNEAELALKNIQFKAKQTFMKENKVKKDPLSISTEIINHNQNTEKLTLIEKKEALQNEIETNHKTMKDLLQNIFSE